MAKTKAIPFNAKTADKLLDLLSTDSEFRRLFKRNPIAGLAYVGYPPAKEAMALMACAAVDSLGSKKEIAAARDQLKDYLVSSQALTNPHCFVAGKIEKALSRK
ncbi:NHLP-related RiPP peptide [Lysobacter koreensis]|uniref:NHLP-related RiPP peptide n=1 Tax=Lysobacter koreensis TaxID=266122 RepID=A0ABW2YQB1_9GAMM